MNVFNKTYKIEIHVSQNPPDNNQKPHFWILLSNMGYEWCNECCGWASSPQAAWEEAYQFYNSFKKIINDQYTSLG